MSLVDELAILERPLLIALDVDGTIAPIVRDPDGATIPKGTRESLEALASASGVILALITGRDLDSLSQMERLGGVWRGVEHGGQVLAPGEQPQPRELTDEHDGALTRFREWARTNGEDVFIEYKPRAVAIHVRKIAETDTSRANALLLEAERKAVELGLHVRKGRCVREAEAVRHDKGEALQEIFERSGARSTFFVGDDVTDLPAIKFANAHGIGAFVLSEENPEAPSESAVAIRSTEEVALLLDELARRLA